MWFDAIDQALTESTLSFAAAKEQNTRMFNAILSVTPDFACAFDSDGRFIYVNRAMSELLGLPSNKTVGKRIGDLDMPNGADMQSDIEHAISAKEVSRGELAFTAGSGAELVYEYVCVPVLDNKGTLETVACTARNITDHKARSEIYFRKANYDALTELPNRSLFSDRLKQNFDLAKRSGIQFALLYIDLDGFKEANDIFGHDTGDLVLQHVAERIRACVRDSDTVARLGGDEFTVIIQDVADADHARTVAESILKNLASPITIHKFTVQISASIGIALFSPGDITPEVMLKNADSAMYAAKKAGRNRLVFFTPAHGKVAFQSGLGRDARRGGKDRRNQTTKAEGISAIH